MTIKTKLFLILGGLGLLFLGFSQANAITPFLSAQVGSGAASGTVLTTNGVTSTWATIPNGGGSGSLTTSTPFFNYGVTYNNNGSISASSSLFVSTSTGELFIQNLETTRYADQFSGSDIGVKINNAETALCAASGGGTIMLPAGQLPFTTSIVISGCPTQLVGQGGGGFYAAGATTLLYNGTGTAYTYNVAGYSSAGIGIFNLSLIGPAGVYAGGSTGIGSSNIASSYGIRAGGSNGEFGFNINGVQVSGFGTALYIDQNASFLNMTNSVLQKNGRDIDSPQLSGANGENMRV